MVSLHIEMCCLIIIFNLLQITIVFIHTLYMAKNSFLYFILRFFLMNCFKNYDTDRIPNLILLILQEKYFFKLIKSINLILFEANNFRVEGKIKFYKFESLFKLLKI